MVRGLDKFKEYFTGFEDNYVIIGGTACEIHEENYALVPRATKDIDIILVIEALSYGFVNRFWQFIKEGNYGERNIGVSDATASLHNYYRFKDPSDKGFPFQLELFSRKLDTFKLPEDAHLPPVPTAEDLSSLSAILLSDEYYGFTIEHSQNEGGVHIASVESLVCLKCKAYIDMIARKEQGVHIDSKEIAKHKKDVFRLLAMLAPIDKFNVPQTIQMDLELFIQLVERDLPNADFMKAAGLGRVTSTQLLGLLQNSFISK